MKILRAWTDEWLFDRGAQWLHNDIYRTRAECRSWKGQNCAIPVVILRREDYEKLSRLARTVKGRREAP